MSAERQMVLDTAERIFADAANAPAETIWQMISAAGLPGLLLPEDEGGFGGDWGDAFSLIRLAGYKASSPQLAEAILGAALFGGEAVTNYESRLAFAQRATGKIDNGCFTGSLHNVTGGRRIKLALARFGGQSFALDTKNAAITEGETLAGDAQDRLDFSAAPVMILKPAVDVAALGALSRIALSASALDAALDLSIGYANERQQFGKLIGKFQAVQQNLAVMAEAAAAVNCAGQAAFQAAGYAFADYAAFNPAFEIAAAKLRANIAADAGTAIAHQVHGAIGFTQDYALRRFTQRLYAWRADFGNERFWAERLGMLTADAGADGLWPLLTVRSDLIAAAQAT